MSLLAQAQSGGISDDDLAHAFESRILPFWNSTVERKVPGKDLPEDERPVAQEVHEYAIARRDWANAIVNTVRTRASNVGSSMAYYLDKTNQLAAQLERRRSDADADLVFRSLVRSWLIVRIRQLILPTPACVRSPLAGYSPGPRDLKIDGPRHR